jgi:ABC-type antimicrobial peptide transport system ATPase subunit
LCNCPDSPWVQRAQAYLSANRNDRNGKWHTINFLLQDNHCGLDNRVAIETILQHLDSNGISLSREQFQQTILGELKREGIVATLVYPGRQGGFLSLAPKSRLKKLLIRFLIE